MATLTRQALRDLLTGTKGNSVTLTLTQSYRVFYVPLEGQSQYPNYTFIGDYIKQDANNHPALGVARKVSGIRSKDFCLTTIDRNGESVKAWIDYPTKGNALLEDGTLTIIQGDPLKVGGITHHLVYTVATTQGP